MAVRIDGGAGTVDNSGSIAAIYGNGVGLFAGGDVNNYAGGNIVGVVIDGASGNVDNSGTLAGTGNGVFNLSNGATFNNIGNFSIQNNDRIGQNTGPATPVF